MNKKEILMVVETVSNEKGVDKETIFAALEAALASATKRRFEGDVDVSVIIDRETGECEAFRKWQIVAPGGVEEQPLEFPERQILLEEAQKTKPDARLGDYLEERIEAGNFGRIAAQTAKQVILQKVREAERVQVFEQYKNRVGELITGVVKRRDRQQGIILDIGGNIEALLPHSELIPHEAVRMGDRLRGYLYEVRAESRGPQLMVTRISPAFLIELFKLEVPEVGQGLIQIKGGARDPGIRAKIAVKANDPRIDPVGACVGMRGSRVQAVSNELGGEKIDIVPWDDNPAQFVVNALSPAEVISIVVDEDAHSIDIAVSEQQLSQAIGRNGQNVRLASELSGWEINIMTEVQAHERRQAEVKRLEQLFIDSLDIAQNVAEVLVREGFSSVEEIAYVPSHEMLEIAEFDEETVDTLRNQARDFLLTQAIVAEEKQDDGNPMKSNLLALAEMDAKLAEQLTMAGIVNCEALAELAVGELLEIAEIDEEKAGRLIMAARAPWFSE